MKDLNFDHNEEVRKEMAFIVLALNKSDIMPIVYGSLGLSFLIGDHFEIGDIDFCLSDDLFSKKWTFIKDQLMSDLGYVIDETHCQEFTGKKYFVSFEQLSKIQKMTSIDETLLKKETFDGAVFYNLSLSQYLDIYQKFLQNKDRWDKKSKRDLEKIDIIKQNL